ncbi:DUF1345 domain-containing protein [Undibacterium jejuense]|uniref:DUF1345 domain-containing protein n=1 Tax=Undibacterium jejuense TaxID=1344949 RepID=A0A923KR16_9BURK|nr:DUF1345 domain-containing protein [Undibacterium jejuense]MBC3863609.1 DUF1345 domain-containing protein [Undibacterium jejuense]
MHSAKNLLLHRPRLLISFSIAFISVFFLPTAWLWTTRALFAWNLAVWAYLLLMAWLMMRANHHRVKAMAIREDKSAVTVLALISLSAMISVGAIVVELSGTKDLSAEVRAMKYLFTGMTVLGSWLLVAVVFCFHYALLFYRSPESRRALRFPDDEQKPDYWDFLYFSFTIAVAAQTSDVAVTSHSARKTVLVQSVLSFFFNVAVLGFSINIAASLVGN